MYAQAASEGARLDLSRDQMAISTALDAQRMRMQQAEIANAQKQTQIATQMKMMELATAKKESDRSFQLNQSKLAIESELQRQKLSMTAQAAAQKFQSQQIYRSTFQKLKQENPDAPDSELAMKSLFASGADPTALAAAVRASSQPNRVTWQPDVNNPDMQVSSTGERRPMPRPQPKFGEPYIDDNGHLVQKNNNTGEVKILVPKKTDEIADILNEGKKASSEKKTLDQAKAMEFLQQAGGDKEKARKMAKDAGYSF